MIITGQRALVDYKRGSAMESPLTVIHLRANVCVYCERGTDRYSCTFRDGKPWRAIPCCDECHEAIRKLPAQDLPVSIFKE